MLLGGVKTNSHLSGHRQTTHQTAQRVIKLWQLLCQGAYTIAQLQQSCLTRDGEPLSLHSIKLYLSTLRAFGCKIERVRNPSADTAYTIRQHDYLQPLLKALTPSHLDRLAENGTIASFYSQQHQWLAWLGTVASWGQIDWRVQLLLDELLPLVDQAINRQDLLHIHYHTLSDQRTWQIVGLPLGGHIRRHRHYLRVLCADRDNPVLLRASRITHVAPAEGHSADLHNALKLMTRYKPLVEVLFKTSDINAVPHLPDFRRAEMVTAGQDETNQVAAAEGTSSQGIRVFLETRDTFLLLQQLTGCGVPFEICRPDSLRQEVQLLFEKLNKRYSEASDG